MCPKCSFKPIFLFAAEFLFVIRGRKQSRLKVNLLDLSSAKCMQIHVQHQQKQQQQQQ